MSNEALSQEEFFAQRALSAEERRSGQWSVRSVTDPELREALVDEPGKAELEFQRLSATEIDGVLVARRGGGSFVLLHLDREHRTIMSIEVVSADAARASGLEEKWALGMSRLASPLPFVFYGIVAGLILAGFYFSFRYVYERDFACRDKWKNMAQDPNLSATDVIDYVGVEECTQPQNQNDCFVVLNSALSAPSETFSPARCAGLRAMELLCYRSQVFSADRPKSDCPS